MLAWGAAGLGVAATEGGFVAVIAKNAFVGFMPDNVLNLLVAVAAAAPATANLMSFYWADFSAGREKTRFVSLLLFAAAGALLSISVLPKSALGLVLFIAAIMASRIFWTGAVTLRSAVWRANFRREDRAAFTGRVTVLSSLAMAAASAACGFAFEYSTDLYRVFYPLAGLAIALAGLVYRRVRVRRHRQLLSAEVDARADTGRGLVGAFLLLKTDRNYRDYMIRMFLFGSGNLMVVGITVLLMVEALSMARFQQTLVTSTIPMLVIPLTIPIWAALFNGITIARFRAIQGVFFASSMLITMAAVSLEAPSFLWLAAALSGTGYAGGNIGWHLGHNAFASDGRATDYMAVHVSLTGLRGILAPIVGVVLYQLLVARNADWGVYALWLPLSLSVVGSLGFLQLDRRLVADASH